MLDIANSCCSAVASESVVGMSDPDDAPCVNSFGLYRRITGNTIARGKMSACAIVLDGFCILHLHTREQSEVSLLSSAPCQQTHL